jgi:hypothetical protein
MDFLKKNYEKVLLVAVLLGFLGAVGYLLFKVPGDKEELEKKRTSMIPRSVRPLTNMDMTLPDEWVKRLSGPAMINFSEPNKLFNPMPWKQKDGIPYRDTSVGLGSATVTNISPLYTRISLDGVSVSGDAGARYNIVVQKEAAARTWDRWPKHIYGPVGTKNETFTLLSAQGNPEDLSTVKLVLELADSGKRVTISTNQPFERIDGYLASIGKYKDQRVGAHLLLDNEGYNIVAITNNEVVLSAPNGKKSSLKLKAAP